MADTKETNKSQESVTGQAANDSRLEFIIAMKIYDNTNENRCEQGYTNENGGKSSKGRNSETIVANRSKKGYIISTSAAFI